MTQRKEVAIVPTIAMDAGVTGVYQCSHCGCLVASDTGTLGQCPACTNWHWWEQSPIVGPFRPIATSDDRLVLTEVVQERRRQDEKWGEQNHTDGTGDIHFVALSNEARTRCQEAALSDYVTWEHILTEEIYEAYAEDDPLALRKELIQAAAVIVAWVAAIDRRES